MKNTKKNTPTKKERRAVIQRQKRKKRLMWGGVLVVGTLLILAAFLALAAQPSYPVDPADAELVALGQQVYQTQCASCHGVNLEGEVDWDQPSVDGLLKAPPHDETGHTWHHNNAYLIDSIVEGGMRLPASSGTSPMPAYKNILSPQEIGAVLSYIESTWSADILAQQSRK